MDFHFQLLCLLVDRKKLNRLLLSSECNKNKNFCDSHKTCACLLILLFRSVAVHRKFCVSENPSQGFTTKNVQSTTSPTLHLLLLSAMNIISVRLFVTNLVFFLDYKMQNKRNCHSGTITLNE